MGFDTVCSHIIEHFTAKYNRNPKLTRNLESGILAWNPESWPNFVGFGISYRIFEDFRLVLNPSGKPVWAGMRKFMSRAQTKLFGSQAKLSQAWIGILPDLAGQMVPKLHYDQ